MKHEELVTMERRVDEARKTQVQLNQIRDERQRIEKSNVFVITSGNGIEGTILHAYSGDVVIDGWQARLMRHGHVQAAMSDLKKFMLEQYDAEIQRLMKLFDTI